MGLMDTLRQIERAADSAVLTYVDSNTPPGHFVAHATVSNIPTSYLIEGDLRDYAAPVVGRVEVQGGGNAAYRGNGLRGGAFVGHNAPHRELNLAILG